jgi:Outer membrane protein beta-barrel domain
MKILLFITILLTYGIAIGQGKNEKSFIQKGTWNIDGEVSIKTANSESKSDVENSTKNETYFSFNPSMGYAIKNNLMIGMGLGYGYGNNNLAFSDSSNRSFNNNSKKYSVFGYIKKYIPVGDKFSLNFKGELNFSKSKNNRNSVRNNLFEIQDDDTTNSVSIGISPGITYFLSKHFALESKIGLLGYTYSKTKGIGSLEGNSNRFNFSLNSAQLFFGISYYY